MFSKVLVKLIDQAIVPAITLVAVRVVSVILISNYFGIDLTLGRQGFEYTNPDDFILVNSYSTFFMVVVVAVGLLYILLKSLIFHDSHIAPHITANLFSLRLSSLIQSSYDLYSQGAIWLSYLYLLTISHGIMAFSGLVFPWVFWVSLVLTVCSTVVLIFDIENEMEIKNMKVDQTEGVVVRFGGFDD